ncbi:MAG: ankyrin repeat domain-containing protein [Candidatus Riflebacteria bacterium]|nr:ankyrin repeat domain-containing protein [Candidatus Riflebacteria bacterium]
MKTKVKTKGTTHQARWGVTVLCLIVQGMLLFVPPLLADIPPRGRRVPVHAWISNQSEFSEMTFFCQEGGPWGTFYYRLASNTELSVIYKMHSLVVMASRNDFLQSEKNAMLLTLINEGSQSGIYEEKSLEPALNIELSPLPSAPIQVNQSRLSPSGNSNLKQVESRPPGVPNLAGPNRSRNVGERGEKVEFTSPYNQPGFYLCPDQINFWDFYSNDDSDTSSQIFREYRIAGFQGEQLIVWLAREITTFSDDKAALIKEMPNPFPNLPKEPPIQTWKYKTIHLAAKAGDLAEVKNFIASGTDVNALDRARRIPLHWAAESGNLELVKFLLAKGNKSNIQDAFCDTPLSAASKKGKVEIVQFLNALDSSSKGGGGVDSLNAAIEKGDLPIIKALLESGVDVKGKNSSNSDTPLHVAARFDRRPLTRVLLEKGADVNALNHLDETPLFGTICNKYRKELVEMARYLISNGAKLEVFNKNGSTPLIKAVVMNAPQLVKLFIEKGADPNIPSRSGKSPLSLAKDENIRKLLRALGARE